MLVKCKKNPVKGLSSTFWRRSKCDGDCCTVASSHPTLFSSLRCPSLNEDDYNLPRLRLLCNTRFPLPISPVSSPVSPPVSPSLYILYAASTSRAHKSLFDCSVLSPSNSVLIELTGYRAKSSSFHCIDKYI
uniref:Uncharacterized protein n=1 Tax=Onchocerca volvulus TaxID=6282 RepID=A0A8R1TTW0_ONCVO